MFVSKKSPLKISKHNKVDPECPAPSRPDPFDSDDEFDTKKTLKPSKKPSSQPNLTAPYFTTNPFDGDEERGTSASSKYFHASAARHEYNIDFRDSGGLENQSIQELENYAVYKAKETTKSVNGCLKIAEDMREGAARTLITLHQQGQQITKTHDVAVEIDHDLSRQIEEWIENEDTTHLNTQSYLSEIEHKSNMSKEMREALGPCFSKLATTLQGPKSNLKEQMERMSHEIRKYEVLV